MLAEKHADLQDFRGTFRNCRNFVQMRHRLAGFTSVPMHAANVSPYDYEARLARDLEVLHNFQANLRDSWPAPNLVPALHQLAPDPEGARALIKRAVASVQEMPADLRTQTDDHRELRNGLLALVGLGSETAVKASGRRKEAATFLHYGTGSLRTDPKIRERHFLYLASRLLAGSNETAPETRRPEGEARPPVQVQSRQLERRPAPDETQASRTPAPSSNAQRHDDQPSNTRAVAHPSGTTASDGRSRTHVVDTTSAAPGHEPSPLPPAEWTESRFIPLAVSGTLDPGNTRLDFKVGGWVVTVDDSPGPSPSHVFGLSEEPSRVGQYHPEPAELRPGRSAPIDMPQILAERLALASWVSHPTQQRQKLGQSILAGAKLKISSHPTPISPATSIDTAIAHRGRGLSPTAGQWHRQIEAAPGAAVLWRVTVSSTDQDAVSENNVHALIPRDTPKARAPRVDVESGVNGRLLAYLNGVTHDEEWAQPDEAWLKADRSELRPYYRTIVIPAVVGTPSRRRNRLRLLAYATTRNGPTVAAYADLIVVAPKRGSL